MSRILFTRVVTSERWLGRVARDSHHVWRRCVACHHCAGHRGMQRIIVTIAAGESHSAAIDDKGTLLVWGDGSQGKLSFSDGADRYAACVRLLTLPRSCL